jgi:PadR family transcriptional regulator PadR
MGKPTDLLQGTLDLLILKTLALAPMHGWGITLRIQQITGEVLQVRPGALYPALHRLEHQGWIRAKWGETVAGRRAKYYSLTRAGRQQLGREAGQWRRLSSAVTALLDTV